MTKPGCVSTCATASRYDCWRQKQKDDIVCQMETALNTGLKEGRPS